MAEFEPNTVEHTFSSGRTFVVRKSLPVTVLMFKAAEDGDDEVAEGLAVLFDAANQENGNEPTLSLPLLSKMMRAVVETMFVSPRVRWDAIDLTDGAIAVEDLDDTEVAEVLELAMAAAGQAARFRGDGPGPDSGDGGKDVVKKPKRAAGSKPRKR